MLPGGRLPIEIGSKVGLVPDAMLALAIGGAPKIVKKRLVLDPSKFVADDEMGGKVTMFSVAICFTEKVKFKGFG